MSSPIRVCALCGRQESEQQASIIGEMLGPFYDENLGQNTNGTCLPCDDDGVDMYRNNDAKSNGNNSGKGSSMLFVHRLCALWSPEVYVNNETGKLRNVMSAIRRGRSLKCASCGEYGATLGCFVEHCQRSYHVPCAQSEGCVFRVQQFIMGCPRHKKRLPHHNVYNATNADVGINSFDARRHSDIDRRRRRISTSRLVKARYVQRKNKGSQEANHLPVYNDREVKTKKGDGSFQKRPTGWDDEDYFQAKKQKSIEKDAAKVVPIMLGSDTKNSSSKGLSSLLLDDEWDNVAGLSSAVQALKEAVILPLLYPDTFRAIGTTPPRGVLLYGNPGTGKTLSVRAMATAASRICNKMSESGNAHRIAFYHRKAADCLGKFHGQAERTLRLLFQSARNNAPSVIFIDEIDGLLPARNSQQDHIHASVVTTMLALMDDMTDRGNVIVIGATNRPESIDPALRRPGRFDREVYCPLPSRDERLKIIEMYTTRWNPKPSKEIKEAVAIATNGYAGADLRALCSSVMMAAFARTKPRLLTELMNEDTLACMFHGSEEKGVENQNTNVPSEAEKAKETKICSVKEMVRKVTFEDETANLVLDNSNIQNVNEVPPTATNFIEEIDFQRREEDKSFIHDTILMNETKQIEKDGIKFSPNLDEINVLPSDWHDSLKKLPPPCSRRAESAAAALDLIGPLPYEVAYFLLPFYRSIIRQLDTYITNSSLSVLQVISNVFLKYPEGKADQERCLCILGSICPPPPIFEIETGISANEDIHYSDHKNSDGNDEHLRILLGGPKGCGQLQLAGCLLNLFSNERIFCITMPLLLSEGGGNVFRGMVSILESMLTFATSAIVLYLPQLELWTSTIYEESNKMLSLGHRYDCNVTDFNAFPKASKVWQVFSQHIDSLRRHRPLYIIATTSVPSQHLGDEIQNFFGLKTCDASIGKQRAYGTAHVELSQLSQVELVTFIDRSSWTIIDRVLLRWLQFYHRYPLIEKKIEATLSKSANEFNDELKSPRKQNPEESISQRETLSKHVENEERTKSSTAASKDEADVFRNKISNSVQGFGLKLLRDERVTSLDDHLMTTEMDSTKTLRSVSQRAAVGDYGTDISAMTQALNVAAAAHHVTATKWLKRNLDDNNEYVGALMLADGAKAAADEYASKLFELEKIVINYEKSISSDNRDDKRNCSPNPLMTKEYVLGRRRALADADAGDELVSKSVMNKRASAVLELFSSTTSEFPSRIQKIRQRLISTLTDRLQRLSFISLKTASFDAVCLERELLNKAESASYPTQFEDIFEGI